MPKVETDKESVSISRESEHFFKSVTQRGADASGLSISCDAASVISVSPAPWRAALIAGGKRFAALVEDELAHGRAFIFAPVFLGGGAAFWFSLAWTPDPALCRTALFIGLALAFVTRHLNRAMTLIAGAIALFAAGMWLAEAQTARRATVILDAPVTLDLRGRVVSREAVAGGGWRYIVDIEATEKPRLKRPPSRVALVARGRHAVFPEGQDIRGRARLSPPSGPAMPGLSDFAFSSYFQGIGAIGFFYGKPEAAASEPVAPEGFVAVANGFISHLRGAIGTRVRSIIPGDAGAFATAMVTDERRAMTRDTAEALRLSGLAHIIAISGLNMALAAGIFFVGLRSLFALHQGFAQAVPIKKLAAAGALAGVTAYYLLSGSAVSAQRAWLMMSVMLIAVLLGRPSISMRNVALSALVIIILSPSDVMGASFQMSFAATVALVAGYALHSKKQRGRPSVLPGMAVARNLWVFFWGIALTSIIGGVSTAIFSIAHFQQLAVWGLPANLAAMPIVSLLVMPAGLLAMLLMPFGLDEWPLRVMGFGLDLVIRVAKEVAGWGGESATGMLPPFVFPLVVAGFLLLTLLKTSLRLIGATLILVTAVAGFALPAREKPALVISEGGDLVGLVGENAIATNRQRPPGFIFSQWRRALKLSGHDRPLSLGDAAPQKKGERPARRPLTAEEAEAARAAMGEALTQGPPGRFACSGTLWCVARHSGGTRIATVSEAAYIDAACLSADLVITPLRLRRSACIRPADGTQPAHFISGVALARNGAVAISFNEEMEGQHFSIETARDGSQRPWTRHRLYDWRNDRFITGGEAADMLDFNDSGE